MPAKLTRVVFLLSILIFSTAHSEEVALSCGWFEDVHPESVEVFDVIVDNSTHKVFAVNPRIKYEVVSFGDKELTFKDARVFEEVVEKFRYKKATPYCTDLIESGGGMSEVEHSRCIESYKERAVYERVFTLNRYTGSFLYMDTLTVSEHAFQGRSEGVCRRLNKLL